LKTPTNNISIAIAEISTENLRICLKIIEDYLLLAPAEFLEASVSRS